MFKTNSYFRSNLTREVEAVGFQAVRVTLLLTLVVFLRILIMLYTVNDVGQASLIRYDVIKVALEHARIVRGIGTIQLRVNSRNIRSLLLYELPPLLIAKVNIKGRQQLVLYEEVDITTTTALLLVAILVVSNIEAWLKHLLKEVLKPSVEVRSSNIRVIAEILTSEL